MTGDDDIRSLLQWLKDKALEAHDAETYSRNGEPVDYDYGVFAGREEMANETIAYIRSMRVNQKPHIVVGGEPLP